LVVRIRPLHACSWQHAWCDCADRWERIVTVRVWQWGSPRPWTQGFGCIATVCGVRTHSQW